MGINLNRFAHDKKFKEDKQIKVPGPGAYTIAGDIGAMPSYDKSTKK